MFSAFIYITLLKPDKTIKTNKIDIKRWVATSNVISYTKQLAIGKICSE